MANTSLEPTVDALISDFEASHTWEQILQGRGMDPAIQYTKFAAWAVLEHGGWNTTATAALRQAHNERRAAA